MSDDDLLGEKQREMLKQACLTSDTTMFLHRPKGFVTPGFAEQFYSDSTDVRNQVLVPLTEGTRSRRPLLEFTDSPGLFRVVCLPRDLKDEIKEEMREMEAED